ncbi:hypothetical protein DRJ22_00955 [Candidatus Woesearchaeota archaeon]|nr:MAG: hypothetical protein DRJ22_00955 [Candidatus Woesearchaeota archaeon]
MMKVKADVCFECSWEVCNKVGGIYTVITSKAQSMIDNYGENYYLIGPYFPKKIYGIFEEEVSPDCFLGVCEVLKKEGIELHFGKWIIKGNPKVILIDFTNFTNRKNEIKKNLWDWFKIDSLNTEYFDFDEPVIWSFAVGRLLEEISKVFNNKKIVAHFHEWLSGAGLLYLKHIKANIASVFTTHATSLGRTIAMDDKRNLYAELENIDPDDEAKRLGPGVFAKHLTEKQCAQNCFVFTTVSQITSIEAEKILGRKPEVLVLNGLDIAKFPSFEEAAVKHKVLNNRIKLFLMYYFFPYYQFDLDKLLVYFIAGRYEFRDKGVDVFIEALGKLNDKLKEEKFDKTIVAFFWIPGNVKAIRPELLQNKTYFLDIKDSLDDIRDDVQNRLLYLLASKRDFNKESIFGLEFLQEIRPKINRLFRGGVPALSTHKLYNEDSDLIFQSLLKVGLDNLEDDPVKVVFYPIYLTGADGLLDTSYYESMIGSDLGVFPSYYEPWGYTPLEAAALSVSSLTTDLSGFGRFIIEKEQRNLDYPGVFVLPRFQKTKQEIVDSLADMMCRFAKFSVKEVTQNKIFAQKIAMSADWRKFIKFYIEAHNLAVDKLA